MIPATQLSGRDGGINHKTGFPSSLLSSPLSAPGPLLGSDHHPECPPVSDAFRSPEGGAGRSRPLHRPGLRDPLRPPAAAAGPTPSGGRCHSLRILPMLQWGPRRGALESNHLDEEQLPHLHVIHICTCCCPGGVGWTGLLHDSARRGLWNGRSRFQLQNRSFCPVPSFLPTCS